MAKKTIAFSCLMAVFLAFWAVGFSSSILAGRCMNTDIDIHSRMAACNWASRTTLSKYVSADHSEYAAMELERVIVLAEAGHLEASASALRDLLVWASIDGARQGNTGKTRDDRVAAVFFLRVQKLDRNSNSFLVFARAFGHQEDPS